MQQQLIGFYMAGLLLQRRHPTTTERDPQGNHHRETGPSRSTGQITNAKPIHECPHKRRRLLGSIGLTGWQTSHWQIRRRRP